MNNPFKTRYPLSESEAKDNAASGINWLLYLVLAAVILITAAHAVMLVLNQTTFTTGDGLFNGLLTVLRVSFPIVVEVAAVVAMVGFIKSQWRGAQKAIGLTIEAIWFMFAAANMITLFAIERGQALQGWQNGWIQYGLPVSALVAGMLTYMLARQDPDHKRANEEALGHEVIRANEFNAYQEARTSGAMLLIQRRRAFRDVVEKLRTEGYDEHEIALMVEHVPDLIINAPGVPTAAGRPSLTDRVRGALGKNTHESRQDEPEIIPLAQPGQGEGNGAPGKPLSRPTNFQ
jgi:hypothetical protein